MLNFPNISKPAIFPWNENKAVFLVLSDFTKCSSISMCSTVQDTRVIVFNYFTSFFSCWGVHIQRVLMTHGLQNLCFLQEKRGSGCCNGSFPGLCLQSSGQDPTGFQARAQTQGQLGFQGHVSLKTGLQDGGDRYWKFTRKMTIWA